MAIVSEEEFERRRAQYKARQQPGWSNMLGENGRAVVQGVADNLQNAFVPRPDEVGGVPPGYESPDVGGVPPGWNKPTTGVPPGWGQQTTGGYPPGFMESKEGPANQQLSWKSPSRPWEWGDEASPYLWGKAGSDVGNAAPKWDREATATAGVGTLVAPPEQEVSTPPNAMSAAPSVSQSTSQPVTQTQGTTALATTPPQNLDMGWAAEFQRVHGRAPDWYDAMVNEEMQGRMKPGQIPTRGDWERLTVDLARRGIKAPGKQDFVAPSQTVPIPSGSPSGNRWDNVAYWERTANQASTPQAKAQAQENMRWAATANAPMGTATPKTTVAPSSAASAIPVAPQAPSTEPLTFNTAGYEQYRPVIEEHAKTYGVDPALITALIQHESGFNPSATSSAGALGLMQLMPETAKWAGLSTNKGEWDYARSNIDAGTKYLKSQIDYYHEQGYGPDENGNDEAELLAIAAYNAGGAAVNAFLRGERPLPEETKALVARVIPLYAQLRASRRSFQ